MRRPGRPKWQHDPIKEMEVFDRLPAKIRAALNEAPVKYLVARGFHVCMRPREVSRLAKRIRAGKLPSIKVDADCN